MGYILLLIAGLAIFIGGLLQAAHKPFQDWRLSHEKKPIRPGTEEYENAIFHMKINGSGVGLIGGLMTVHALGELGGERLLLIAGILFVAGLLFVGVVKLWKKLTSRK